MHFWTSYFGTMAAAILQHLVNAIVVVKKVQLSAQTASRNVFAANIAL